MITVRPDIVKNNRNLLGLRTDKYWRVFLVEGITGPASACQIAARAAVDSTSGLAVPQMYDAHPSQPGAYCEQVKVEGVGGGVFRVVCGYSKSLQLGGSAGYLESAEPSVWQNESFYDIDGNLITVTYNGIKQHPRCVITEVGVTCCFTFMQTLNPRAINVGYANYVNSAPWLGLPAFTWRFDGVRGSTKDGLWYVNRYSFTYRPGTWYQFKFYEDSTGYAPAGMALFLDPTQTSGNGWVRVLGNRSDDFNLLFPITE